MHQTMMPLCRVRWTTPDEETRRRALQSVMGRYRSSGRAGRLPMYEMSRDLDSEPGIDAVHEHTGVLMTAPVFVPAYVETSEERGSLPGRATRVHKARWVCLVAVAVKDGGMREMDPRELSVVGVMQPGEAV